jgi:hypothetical protein
LENFVSERALVEREGILSIATLLVLFCRFNVFVTFVAWATCIPEATIREIVKHEEVNSLNFIVLEYRYQ